MRTFNVIIILLVSAFLFVTISTAQQQTTKKKKKTVRTEQTETSEETGQTDKNMQQEKTKMDKKMTGNTSGKEIFETNKCTTCHEMKAEKIKKTGKSNAPDLSTVGADKKAEWVEKFLKKNETLDGKKHPIAFKGTNDELKTLATWITEHGKK